jgi:type VI secretion system protein VasJ
LLNLILEPIPGDNPFGMNINYEPEFDTIKTEIGKLGDVDWEAIETNARTILKEKSKDIRVLAFVSYVYLRNESWEAFADVFDGLTQLAVQNYEGLFPERPRAKQLAFKWLSEARYSDTLDEKKPGEADHDHCARLAESLQTLKATLEEKFSEGSPFPGKILTSAQKWEKATTPKPAEEPKPAPAQAGAAAPSAATAGAQTSQEPMETPKQAQAAGKKVAQFLIETEPARPMGYRLLRCIRWDVLEKAPPAENGQTQLAAPNPQQRAYFQKLLGDGDWKTALAAAEKAFNGAANHFWLDLQRIAATAAKQLGADYEAVNQAICIETALLVKRIPQLPDLAFSDGSPFCDPATRDWISGEAMPNISDGSGGAGVALEEGLDEERKEVNALAAAGKTEQALDFVQKAIAGSSNERHNFRRSLMVGSLMLSAKRADIALAVLEELDDKIDRFRIDLWDSGLAIEAWALLVSAYKAWAVNKPQNIQAQIHEKQNTILQKLSRTDPKSAFKLAI